MPEPISIALTPIAPNNTCNCGDVYCVNYNCSFVVVGEGCQEVSINTLTPQI